MGDGVCIVTGGASGLGRAISEGIARAGRPLVLVCRDRQRAEQARDELAALTGSPVDVVIADLSRRDATAAAAVELRARFPRIQALVHNAGIWPTRLVRTADGFEESFAVNHLAPFLLNAALADRLIASGARVVQVTAGLYIKGRVDLERTPTGTSFHRFRTYADTKLCNLLCTMELARRCAGQVTVNAVHPGVVRSRLGDLSGPLGVVLRLVKRRWAPPAVGARGPLRLVLEPGSGTGSYYDQLAPAPLAPPALDRALAQALWQRSLQYAGLA